MIRFLRPLLLGTAVVIALACGGANGAASLFSYDVSGVGWNTDGSHAATGMQGTTLTMQRKIVLTNDVPNLNIKLTGFSGDGFGMTFTPNEFVIVNGHAGDEFNFQVDVMVPAGTSDGGYSASIDYHDVTHANSHYGSRVDLTVTP